MFKLFSVPISVTTKLQALALVGEWVKEWRMLNDELRMTNENFRIQHSTFNTQHSTFPKIITTPNPEMIVAAQTDPEFLKVLQSADLAIPDGVGIVWAVKLLGYQSSVVSPRLQVNRFSVSRSQTDKPKTDKPETENRKQKTDNRQFHRLSGLDFMESLINEAARRGWQVMFLGGRPGVAEKAAEKLQLPVLGYQLSDLSQPVVGLSVVEADEQKTDKPETENRKQKTDNQLKIKSINGPEDVSHVSKFDNDRLITSINHVQPDLLFVAFGHGRQEKWLSANRYRLNAGVAMGVGGAFDQIADPSLRSPAYINSIGLGWLYRLIRQPWRIKRQLALVKFVGMVFRQKLQFSSSKLQ